NGEKFPKFRDFDPNSGFFTPKPDPAVTSGGSAPSTQSSAPSAQSSAPSTSGWPRPPRADPAPRALTPAAKPRPPSVRAFHSCSASGSAELLCVVSGFAPAALTIDWLL
ncbi:ADP-ribosylation factor-binding protein GGA3-like, partial [Malurus melanocephalus]|uniref:ADP-ribosylation factor-binding protein GGA3-like n=1 Tax=Malurus melanocephalus TaxID=175006 RepID=UPI0025498317